MGKLIRSWKIWIGIGLFLVGVLTPYWLKPQLLELDNLLKEITHRTDGNTLMIGAFLVVSINTIVSVPQFLSVVMLGDGTADIFKRPELRALVPLLFVPLSYVIINLLTPLNYSFGATDILLWLMIVIMQKLSREKVNSALKLLVFGQLIFGITWLNQVPILTPYGFGWGSLSMKVKQAAVQIGFGRVLSLYAYLLFTIFVASAITLWVYMILYMEKWMMAQELSHVQHEAWESRSEREVHNLVHDLKTPLSAIEGLVSLMGMRWPEPKMQEYCQIIHSSIHSMSNMISEILYEDQKDWCRLQELIDYIRASRLSGTDLEVTIELEGDAQSRLYINKIRMTRAIINLIDNAFDAIHEQQEGRVVLRAKILANEVRLEVEDNGCGILPEKLRRIWKAGYSTKNHPGVGLAFVRQVAEGHGGSVNVKSKVGEGTKFWITLPLGECT